MIWYDVPFEPTSAGLLPKHLAQVGLGRGKDPCGKCSRRNSWRLVAPAPDLRWLVIDDGQKHWKSWHFVYKDHWLTKIQTEKQHADVSWWPITFIWSWEMSWVSKATSVLPSVWSKAAKRASFPWRCSATAWRLLWTRTLAELKRLKPMAANDSIWVACWDALPR